MGIGDFLNNTIWSGSQQNGKKQRKNE